MPPLASVTVRLKTELVALQVAIMSAVTLPVAPMMTLEIVTPVPETKATLTAKELAGWSASETVAIGELADGLPCCCESGPAAVIVGGVLTDKVKLVLEVAPQLSVAVTVSVYVPAGAALVTLTMPVVGLMLNEPVKPADAVTVRLEIVPLSVGATEGVTVVLVPVLIGPVLG